ncbi:monovalent cation/H+ antiporter subunit D [Aquibaculum sediminis]|uniref:monovalent cation/H+ antiporter subunit D n=1 Tax=Aquibaculum sediminis TaxID=3231907 RepID=UPI003456B564
MNHWILVPIVLPSLLAPLIVLAARHDIVLQRCFSLAGVTAMLAVSIGLLVQAAGRPPQVYDLGNWPAPFGIVMVLDRLSALMLVLASLLALLVLIYAVQTWDSRGRHFHALFQFQMMGVAGAFLTGDLFNLFVFFEVLLIASYGLMLHGAGAERLRAGFQYVAVNLAGSTLFLVALGLIYGVTGTLNMADLAVRVPLVPESDQALLRTGGLLLLIVFAIKAALVPLHFWLPQTYAAASAPVAALFAIMTKVGAYSILRVFTLIFGEGAGEMAWLAAPWLMPAALVTLVLGMVGVVAARNLRWMVCFGTIGSMGTLLIALGAFTVTATSAGLYYLVHSTFVAAALFLLADQVAQRRGSHDDSLAPAPRYPHIGLLSALFFVAAIAMVGMPPLSGFVGKLLILDGVRGVPLGSWAWVLLLSTSVLMLLGFARAGSRVFWKPTAIEEDAGEAEVAARPAALPLVAIALLLFSTVLLTAFAGPVMDFLDGTAAQLFEPRGYIAAVLGPEAPFTVSDF